MKRIRKILHVDMDAFYASIEQRDNPELRGKPVIVGGPAASRSVVCTASYEARRFGVHSAMPSAQAARLCPQGIFVSPRMSAYKEASQQIREIFSQVTEMVEPLSYDEAYLDVTSNFLGERSATRVAQLILGRIKEETGLTASAGVAYNKFLAKLASDMDKPNGLTVISPDKVDLILPPLPVRKISGIGKATEKRLHQQGFHNISDLREAGPQKLLKLFGKSGAWYHSLAWGIDERPVQARHMRKSLGAERTFSRDFYTLHSLHIKLDDIIEEVLRRLESSQFKGRTITLKVTYNDFKRISRSTTPNQPQWNRQMMTHMCRELLTQTEAGSRPIRLLGVSLSNPIEEDGDMQLALPFQWQGSPSHKGSPEASQQLNA